MREVQDRKRGKKKNIIPALPCMTDKIMSGNLLPAGYQQ
jgi:hypothetical protein